MPPLTAVERYRVREGDYLRVVTASAVATSLHVEVRLRYDDGTEGSLRLGDTVLGSTRAIVTYHPAQAQKNGYVVGASAGIGLNGVAAKRGQVYVAVQLFASENLVPLMSGYVYDWFFLGLGQFHETGPGGGQGFIRTVTGTNPAAGVEILETVPANAVWRLLNFTAVFVAAAVAVNRTPILVVDDGAIANRRLVSRDSQGDPIQTGETRTVSWFEGYDVRSGAFALTTDFVDTQTVLMAGLIPLNTILPEGYRIRTITGALEATDDWAAPIFQVEEWVVI